MMSLATTQEHPEPGNVVLRPEIRRAGQDALAKAHPGARFPYVFHGSSGSKQQDLDRAISFGVAKAAMASRVREACRRFGSAGRALAIA
jgi:fructose/tagatose bisphosphate aldolase